MGLRMDPYGTPYIINWERLQNHSHSPYEHSGTFLLDNFWTIPALMDIINFNKMK